MKKQLEIEKKIYDMIYKNSRVDIIRYCNEDEWPIEEIAEYISEETEKSYQEGFENGAQSAANEVADAIACGRY